MDTIDRIIELLNEQGYNQKDLTDYLGIKKSVFSAWKSKKSKSYNKYLTQIAEFFQTDVEELKRYELKEAAIKKHGFCWEYEEREHIKADARNALNTGNLNDEEIIENAILVFKALFSRSLEGSYYSTKHVSFNDYTAMLLNQEFWKETCQRYGDGIYEKLVGIFGKRAGIKEGTYFDCSGKKNALHYGDPRSHSHIDVVPSASALKHTSVVDSRTDDKQTESSNTVQLPPENVRMIPLYESVSAGFGAYADSTAVGYIPSYIKSDWEADNSIAVKVKGDSMYPKIEDGDIVIICKDMDYEDGKIVVARIDDDEAVVKRLRLFPSKLVLESINPEYQDRIFEKEDMNRVHIEGVVRTILKKV